MSASTSWMSAAACAEEPDLPWTTDLADLEPGEPELLAAVCASCPVWVDCWAYADSTGVKGGWWAGADWGLLHGAGQAAAERLRRGAA